jgi:type I restriction-modification system DNA methylase subunit
MKLDELLAILEYDQSSYYRNSETQFEPETVYLFRAARKAGVDGIYVFRTSSSSGPNQTEIAARPAVFVAEAKTVDEARQIHCRLWNLRYAPFVIISLPDQIRIYTGFDYSPEPMEASGFLHPVTNLDLAVVRDKLSYLSADAIDTGQIWHSSYAKRFDPNRQVDSRLLANLRMLSAVLDKTLRQTIEDQSQRLEIVHSLIGKYIYIRYLRDRNILSDEWLHENRIDLNLVLGRNATVKELQKLVTTIEDRFNGYIFPLNFDAEKVLDDDQVRLVASIFKGDEITFANFVKSKQLHLDFRAYDFEYIPVETLSAIYEQFLRTEEDVKRTGAIYTPEVLADYLLSEVNSTKPLTQDMKILDPACGSGIFLVLAYRRLIEMEVEKHPGHKLPPETIKKILINSIYGVERKRTACYVTEFSLILTLLNYIDPPELHKNPDFKFPNLHNEHIFECDFFDDASNFWQLGLDFDWIVGNPPWIELKPKTEEEDFVRKWLLENRDERPAPGNRVADAFSWRIGDRLKSDGVAGLILPATSLFNLESREYRQKFFEKHDVFRITNFANLRDILFDRRATLPAATIIYGHYIEGREKTDIVHYGPFSVNQTPSSKSKLWAITINENEIQVVPSLEAESGETSVWKFALWGSHFDKRAIARLKKLFPTTLEKFCENRDWGVGIPRQGPEFCDDNRKPRAHIKGKKIFDTTTFNKIKPRYRFSIPSEVLQEIESDAYFRRGEEAFELTTPAPHIIISPAWGNFIIYSDNDFIIRPRQFGVAGPKDDKQYLQALSVYLNSSLAAYYIFFNTQEWGIFRSAKRVTLNEVRKIPTPNFTFGQARDLAELQEELAEIEKTEISHPHFSANLHERLQNLLDERVFNILQIPADIAMLAKEFMGIRLKLDRGQTAIQQVTRSPQKEELIAYAQELRNELDDFVLGTAHHKVSLKQSDDLIECKVEVTSQQQPIPVNEESVRTGDLTTSKLLSDIRHLLSEEFSQWVYIRRGLRLFGGSNIYIYKSPRLIDWTRTQAFNDASDIIGEIYSTSLNDHEEPQAQPEYH